MLIPAAAADPEPPHELSAADVEAFLDPLLKEQLEKHKAAGAVVTVVKDGHIVFAKGYGYADIAARRPMTADTTLVRPGSISKLFTGIAVMQLVEQGKLDLDRDVNDYLDFHIPTPEGGVPVTLRRLMTHRAGFEEHFKDVFSANPAPLPLGPFLARSLPPRLFPKGDTGAYSNYGLSLAGYIVERISGEPYSDYVERRILQPLGMTHSSFRQPLPDALAPLAAKSYRTAELPPLPFFETINVAPAGALSASANDMGRFMLALLNGGALDGARILSRESLAAMMTPQVAAPLGSMGLVFYETKHEGVPFIGHGGGTMGFYSQLLLSPQNRLGLFVSYDGYYGLAFAGANGDLLKAFVHRYLPPAPAASPDSAGSGGNQWAAGVYQSSRRADSTMVRLSALISGMLVSVRGDGGLTLHSALWPFGEGLPLRRIGPHLYDNPLAGEVSFEQRPGQPARLYLSAAAAHEFEQIPWWIDARFVMPALLASLVISLLTLLAWPVAAVWRWRKGRSFDGNPGVRRAHLASRLIAAVQFSVVIAAGVLFIAATADSTIMNDALDPVLVTLYALAWLSAAASAVSVSTAWMYWRRRVRSLWTRLHQTALAASAVMLAWFFVVWHIAGTTLNY